MEHGLISKNIAIVGGGPAGCMCAKILSDAGFEVTVFESRKVLGKLLLTGGGKCNLSHAEYDFKELSKNYPRGEKFLYSVFSRFGVEDTVEFFKRIGVETYVREDNRIFPVSNSAKDVREKILHSIKNVKFISETVINIEQSGKSYIVKTNKSKYLLDIVVISTGGGGTDVIKNLDINVTPQTPSLVGFITKDDYSLLAGVSLKNVSCESLNGDILFTHRGVSGPLIYTISSIKAKEPFPFDLKIKLTNEMDFQKLLNENSQKEIKNLLGQFLPKSFAVRFLSDLEIDIDLPCHKINSKIRNKIYDELMNYKISVTGKIPDSEVVTCGGVDLSEMNPKTLEAKKCSNLYFCGEVMDIDGFCGGFNLQNCWSTGFVVAKSIIDKNS